MLPLIMSFLLKKERVTERKIKKLDRIELKRKKKEDDFILHLMLF